MSRQKKTIVIILAALSAVLVAAAVYSLHIRAEEPEALRFGVRTPEGGSMRVESYFSPADSCHYLFLPSFADSSRLVLLDGRVRQGSRLLLPGDSLSIPTAESAPPVSAADGGRVVAVRLGGVPLLSIRMGHRAWQQVQGSWQHRVCATMDIYAPDGKLLYDGGESHITVKSRGNSTWWSPKKPLLLILPQPRPLLGMPPGRKWVLLSNVFDHSNLRNKIVLDFAATHGTVWCPTGRFVDLVVDGRYWGLFLLTEKVELADSRLDPAGGPQYLFLNDIIETIQKTGKPSYPFFSDQRVALEGYRNVRGPIPYDTIQASLAELKATLQQGDSLTADQLGAIIDTPSWAFKYLVDEMFANGDCWRRSNYFHCTGHAPYRFYGGPVWDFDMSMGGGAAEEALAMSAEEPTHTLFNSPPIRRQAARFYTAAARPYILRLIEGGLDSMSRPIAPSARANALRWDHPVVPAPDGSSPDIQQIKDFFVQRIPLLDSLFLGVNPLPVIAYENPDTAMRGFYTTTLYHPGRTLGGYMGHPADSLYRHTLWIDSATMQHFTVDSVLPPGSRLAVAAPQVGTDPAPTPRLTLRKWLLPALFTIALLFLFAALLLREADGWRHQHKNRP